MTRLPTIAELLDLTRRTLNDPRAGAAEVLSQRPGREPLWLMFALVMVLSVIGAELETLIVALVPVQLITVVLLQAGVALLLVLGIYGIGRAFGGRGDFDGALVLVTWLNFIFLFVQLARIALLLLLPGVVADIFMMLSFALFLWLLVNFVAELHGFGSLGRVFLGVIAVAVVVSLLLARLADSLGVTIVAAS